MAFLITHVEARSGQTEFRGKVRITGKRARGSVADARIDPTKSVDRIPAVWRVLTRHLPRLRKAEALCEERAHRISVRLLVYYAGYQQLLWRALSARRDGRPDARELLGHAADFLRRTEPKVYRWMDSPYWYDWFHGSIERAWDREDAPNGNGG